MALHLTKVNGALFERRVEMAIVDSMTGRKRAD